MTMHIDMIPDSMDETRVTYEAYCIQCLSYFGWSRHYREMKEAVDRHTCNPQILKQEKEHMTDITGYNDL